MSCVFLMIHAAFGSVSMEAQALGGSATGFFLRIYELGFGVDGLI